MTGPVSIDMSAWASMDSLAADNQHVDAASKEQSTDLSSIAAWQAIAADVRHKLALLSFDC